MLPACRTADETFAIPQFALTRGDIDSFMEELRGFHTAFRACFARQEPRDQFFNYMVGQCSALERKSIEPIALQVEGGKVRAMQRLVSEALWDEAAMLETYHRLGQDEMGEPDGVLIVDETGFVKKGADSVGVARQYCGSLGKVENCQVGVFAAYASRQGYALVDKRLFLPEPWFSDAYQGRRTKCKLPDEVGWQSTPQLAAAMVQALHQAGILPFKSIVADCLYGNRPDFWAACEACVGTGTFVATPADTRGWLQPLATTLHPYTYKGAQRTKRVTVTDTPPSTVAALAHAIPAMFWYRRTVSEGTKGPITYEFARKRIRLCKEGQPTTAVWLLIKRTLGAHPRYWYYVSNAPLSAPLRLLVWLSGVRWASEQCFEETKTELGMEHYEVRKYPGWHHHMLTCMLAHFFLWHLQIRLEKKAPALTVSQVRRLLEVVLPLKVFHADEVLQLIAGMQQRHHQKRREAPSFTAGMDRRWARRAQCPRAQQYPRSARALNGRRYCMGGGPGIHAGEDVHLVEPENRLVARSLEQHWEDMLRVQEELEQTYQRWVTQPSVVLTESDRQEILRLGADLPAVWAAPTTTNAERKHLVRVLIRDVIVNTTRVRGRVWCRILWHTGATSEHCFARTVQRYTDHPEADTLQQRLRALTAAQKLDAEIAAILNAEGCRSARGRVFTGNLVWLMRQQWHIPTVKINGTAPNPPQWPDGTYSVEGVAAAVGVQMGTVYTWVRTGRIPGIQITKGMPWKLPLTEAQIASLKEYVHRVRRIKRSKKEAV